MALGKRCHLHGGYCTGPTSFMGKAQKAAQLLSVRITNGGLGKPKTDKAKRRRELAAKRALRRSRAQKRIDQWQRRQAIAQGLPLYNDNDAAAARSDGIGDRDHSSE